MKTNQFHYYLISALVLLSSCVKDNLVNAPEDSKDDVEVSELEITQLTIPKDFDFSTQQQVVVTINDNVNGVIYDVYAYSSELIDLGPVTYENEVGEMVTENQYSSDVLNQLLFSGRPNAGKLSHTIAVPTYYSQLYLRRKENGIYSSEIIDVSNGMVSYTHVTTSNKASKSGVVDYLYCVNGNAELFQIDPLDGSYTDISTMPMGSFTAAIDQENKMLYSIGKSSPYPLMRYDIVNDQWTTIKNLGFGGPRLGYQAYEGLLYFATGASLKKLDPVNGNTMSTWSIVGLDESNGGDLDFDSEGNIFMSTTSGLYGLELIDGSYYQATRISADNLPFYPPSMAFDSNDELWISSVEGDADIMIMDTQTGGWEYRYGKNVVGSSSYGRAIHDFTTFRIFDQNPVDVDTDGDGIADGDDKYPDDADKAFESFTPSKYGNGTLAFEDLWPFTGDYDFNDIAVNYKVIAIENSENKVVQVDFDIEVVANGASFVNALGIEIEGVLPSKIESVTGTVLTQNYIVNNANGTEAGQDNAVIILYDNNNAMLNMPITVSVKFTEPITTAELGTAPFNPFMIINKERAKEVHLPYAHTTSLGQKIFVVEEGVNKDPDGDYVTEQGLPWAINIVHSFNVPKEKVPVNEAYNHFNTWATSGGASYSDWYKDSAGYRNTSKIK